VQRKPRASCWPLRILPCSKTAWIRPLEQYPRSHDRLGRPLPASGSFSLARTTTRVASLADNVWRRNLRAKANVVIFSMPAQPNMQDRQRGYKDALERSPNIKITRVVDIQGDPRIAFDTTTQIIGKEREGCLGRQNRTFPKAVTSLLKYFLPCSARSCSSVTSSITKARAIVNLAHGHHLTRAACGCARSKPHGTKEGPNRCCSQRRIQPTHLNIPRARTRIHHPKTQLPRWNKPRSDAR
jgi:hypothetical protein